MTLQGDSDGPPAGADRRDVRRPSHWFTATLPLVVVLWTLIASLAGAAPPRSWGPQFGTASGPISGADARRDGDRKLLRSNAETVALAASRRPFDRVGSPPDPQTTVTFAAVPSAFRLAASSTTFVGADHRVLARRAIRVGDPRAPPTSGGFPRPIA